MRVVADTNIIIYKLGGSLLTLGDLPERLLAAFELWKGFRKVLVIGGGPVADFVREMFRIHRFSEEDGHWLAVRGLCVTSHLAATVVPGCRVVGGREDCDTAWASGHIPILDTYSFLAALEAQEGFQIPHQWEFTSDSISALVARQFCAAELVLLKSLTIPPGTSLDRAAEMGCVDRYLAEICQALPRVTWINLREQPLQPVPVLQEL